MRATDVLPAAYFATLAQAPDGTIRIFCKGSDAVMLPRIRAGTDPDLLESTDRNLHAFSVKGLRTLVVASRVCPQVATVSGEGQGWGERKGFCNSCVQQRQRGMLASWWLTFLAKLDIAVTTVALRVSTLRVDGHHRVPSLSGERFAAKEQS